MTWFHSTLYGFLAGIADILPVSAPAHTALLKALMGEGSVPPMMQLMMDIGILAALYYCCQNHIIRMMRAVRLSRIPKRRRKRPLDARSLMELQMLKYMVTPVVLALLFHSRVSALTDNLLAMAGLLLINGILLYFPQFLPGGNKDARNMTPVDSLLVGLGGAAGVLPGISSVGAAASLTIARGGDKRFALDMALLLAMAVSAVRILMDFFGIFATGLQLGGFVGFLSAVSAGIAAFGGVFLGVKVMRKMAERIGFAPFALYSWGAALFEIGRAHV